MSTISLLLGLTGAGKTTLSTKISRERKEMIFALDEWMKKLYWMDAPATQDLSWALERIDRCLSVIESCVVQELKNGRGVILDLGSSKPKDRERWINFAKINHAKLEILFLDIPADLRWSRVEKRNQSLGPADIKVERATFDWMESYFEPPTPQELPYTQFIT